MRSGFRGCGGARRMADATSGALLGPLLAAVLLFVAVGCGSDRPALPGPVGSGPPLAPNAAARNSHGVAPTGDAIDADAESSALDLEISREPVEGLADDSGRDADPDAIDDADVTDADDLDPAEVDEGADSTSVTDATADEEHEGDRDEVGSPLVSSASASGGRVDLDIPGTPGEPGEPDAGPERSARASADETSDGDATTERLAGEPVEDGADGFPPRDEEDLTDLAEAEDPDAVARRSAEEAVAAALLEALSAAEQEEPARAPSVDHASFDAILQATVRGDRVDYKALQRDHAGRLKAYLDQLAQVDDRALSWEEERLAFYINLYNASMFQAVLDRSAEGWTPAADSFRVFDDKLVRLMGRQVSLNHLENEIIRKEFKEPRIHVALVCGARSCPTIRDRAYDPRTLDETLDENMRGFLASGFRNRVDRRSRKLMLSHIFDWYADDFGGKDKVAAYVDRYVSGDVSTYAVEFIEYQWELNAVR